MPFCLGLWQGRGLIFNCVLANSKCIAPYDTCVLCSESIGLEEPGLSKAISKLLEEHIL